MGRVMTDELQRRDVELYRSANCNFIRTSHYPPCEELLDVCDELGMFGAMHNLSKSNGK